MRKTLKFILLGVFLLASLPAAAADTVYYLFRHAEKTHCPINPGLTDDGRERAEALAAFLKDKGVTRIFSSDKKRTKATVAPLAQATGIAVEFYDPRDLAPFAERLRAMAGVIVVVGHSNTTPELAALLTGLETEPMDESEYDRLYEVYIEDPGIATINVLNQKQIP